MVLLYARPCDIVSYGDGVLLYPLVHFTKNLLIELVVGGFAGRTLLCSDMEGFFSHIIIYTLCTATPPQKSQLAPQDSNRSQAIRIIFALIEFLAKSRLLVWG